MSDNIFENACLIQLRTSAWTGTKQLSDAELAEISDVPPEWMKGKKLLVNPEMFSNIKNIVYRARKSLILQALPFPIDSLTLVPRDNIVSIENRLQDYKHEFDSEVSIFASNYASALEEAKLALGNQFCDADYPMDIFSKFAMNWRFITLSVPKKSSVLPAQLYEREKQKFMCLMADAKELAIASMRDEFQGIVSHLVNSLTEKTEGRPKILREGMFEKFNEFFDNFSSRNIFKDDELAGLVNQAKSHINGLNGAAVRSNTWLKEKLSEEMQTIKASIDTAIETMPRRKIRFADNNGLSEIAA